MPRPRVKRLSGDRAVGIGICADDVGCPNLPTALPTPPNTLRDNEERENMVVIR